MNSINNILKASQNNSHDAHKAILAACLILSGENPPEEKCEQALALLRAASKEIDSQQEKIETMALNNLRRLINDV